MSYLNSTWLIMSGYDQAAPSRDLQPRSADMAVETQTYEASSLEDAEAMIKFGIWSRCSQLLAIYLDSSKSGPGRYEVQLKYLNLPESGGHEFDTKSVLQQQQGFENYKSTNPLYAELNHNVLPGSTFLSYSDKVVSLSFKQAYTRNANTGHAY